MMAMVTAVGLGIDYSGETLFENINFEVQKGDRIGLIGVNGSGKTTLFKILAGEISAFAGSLVLSKDTKTGYMEQHVCRNLERSAYDEVLTVFEPLLLMESEIETLNRKIEQSDGKDLTGMVERQSFLTDEFHRLGGLTCRARARSALLGLGFGYDELGLQISSLSGGQRAKLQMAKLLLSDSNILLLDEPTNHLDSRAVEWLEDYLLSSSTTYLVISHDRYFLDRTTNRTFELAGKKLSVYKGNYSAYLPQAAERRLSAQRQYDKTEREIKRLEGIVAQQRRWNREHNIRAAESKLKAIDRLEQTLVKPPKSSAGINFRFETKCTSGEDVLKVKELSLSFGEKNLFNDISFELHRGERIFILGPNGCGKTSFLKILMKEYAPSSGGITFGEGVKIGYYDQIQQGMDSEKTVLEEVAGKFPSMTNTEVRSLLARFLFRGDDVQKSLSVLSGGERARVLLAELILGGANLLLLDEPTNHLDIASCEVLQEALAAYEGTLVVVSHDRYLINALADKILYLTPKGALVFYGGYDDFIISADPFKKPAQPASEDKKEKKQEYKNKKAKDAERRRARAGLGKCEQDIADCEAVIEDYNTQLSQPKNACDYIRIAELTELIEQEQLRLDGLYERWEELTNLCGDV